MSVTLIIHFRVKPEKLTAFTKILADVKRSLPGTGGCRDIRILTGVDDPNAISLVETWSSKAAHQEHFDAIVKSGEWQRVASHLTGDPSSAYYQDVL